MTTRFVDRVVLVTGGGSGIGRETALAFAREGAAVVVSGRNADALAQTEKIGRYEGLEVGAAVADVTVPDEVERLVAEGFTNRRVASRLRLSPHTVDSHLRNIFGKLDISSRVELARRLPVLPVTRSA